MEAFKKEIIITNPKQIDISDIPLHTGEKIELIVLKDKRDKGKTKQRPIGLAKGEFDIPDNFDDPLPQDIQKLFEGK